VGFIDGYSLGNLLVLGEVLGASEGEELPDGLAEGDELGNTLEVGKLLGI